MKSVAKKALRALWGRSADRIPDAVDDGIKLVSFDVFDTLVVRSCGAPEKVFDLVGATAQDDGLVDDGEAFAEARVKAEKAARARSVSNSEITLDEIYDQLRSAYGEDTDDLMQLELACELAVCGQNSVVAAQMREVAKTHEVVIVSDMYLPDNYIASILRENGLGTYDTLYVSSSTGKTKRKGDLFELVLSDYGVEPACAIHVGDHPLSDYRVPKRLGMNAFLYRKRGNNG